MSQADNARNGKRKPLWRWAVAIAIFACFAAAVLYFAGRSTGNAFYRHGFEVGSRDAKSGSLNELLVIGDVASGQMYFTFIPADPAFEPDRSRLQKILIAMPERSRLKSAEAFVRGYQNAVRANLPASEYEALVKKWGPEGTAEAVRMQKELERHIERVRNTQAFDDEAKACVEMMVSDEDWLRRTFVTDLLRAAAEVDAAAKEYALQLTQEMKKKGEHSTERSVWQINHEVISQIEPVGGG